MALTPSTMLTLGTQAPDFRLPDTEGMTVSLANILEDEARRPRHAKRRGDSRFPQRAPGAAGDLPLQPLPLRQARPPRAGQARAASTSRRAWPSSASAPTTSTAYPDDRPEMMAQGEGRGRLHLPLPLRRDPGRRPGVSGGLHARLLRLRPRPEARLPRPARRQPARQRRPRHRQGPPRRARRRPRRPARPRGAAAEHGLQHQVEAGQRAGLLNSPLSRGRIDDPPLRTCARSAVPRRRRNDRARRRPGPARPPAGRRPGGHPGREGHRPDLPLRRADDLLAHRPVVPLGEDASGARPGRLLVRLGHLRGQRARRDPPRQPDPLRRGPGHGRRRSPCPG